MSVVNGNIDDVISYLQRMKEKGYKTVEIIDYWRAKGWQPMCTPSIQFIVCEQQPTVLGIDMREYVEKK